MFRVFVALSSFGLAVDPSKERWNSPKLYDNLKKARDDTNIFERKLKNGHNVERY